jgi:hypothetical protein
MTGGVESSQSAQDPHEAASGGQPVRPRSVQTAVGLWYSSLALYGLATLIVLVGSDPSLSPATEVAERNLPATFGATDGRRFMQFILSAALLVFFISKAKAGRNWARIVMALVTANGLLGVISLSRVLELQYDTAFVVSYALRLLATATAIVGVGLMFWRESNQYFRAVRGTSTEPVSPQRQRQRPTLEPEPAGEDLVAKVLRGWKRAEELSNDGWSGETTTRFQKLCDATVSLVSDERPDYAAAATTSSDHGIRLSRDRPTSPEQARLAAKAATMLLSKRPAHGMRLALEAHVAFMRLSDAQGVEMRYQFKDFGVPWARALVACSREWRRVPDGDPLSLHFARWAANVTGHLTPFAAIDRDIGAVIREALEQARDLEEAVGDPEKVSEITRILHRY